MKLRYTPPAGTEGRFRVSAAKNSPVFEAENDWTAEVDDATAQQLLTERGDDKRPIFTEVKSDEQPASTTASSSTVVTRPTTSSTPLGSTSGASFAAPAATLKEADNA